MWQTRAFAHRQNRNRVRECAYGVPQGPLFGLLPFFFSSLLLLCGLSCPSISILTIVLITLIRFSSSLLWSCWNGARATQCNVHERKESGTRRNGQTLFPWHQRAQCTHRTTPHRTTQNLELDIYWLLYFRFSTSPATIISHRTRRAIHLFFSLSHLASRPLCYYIKSAAAAMLDCCRPP